MLETSYYIHKQFKAFRSLEANNQMVSGFLVSFEGHIVVNKFVDLMMNITGRIILKTF